MNTITHFLAAWIIADIPQNLSKRDLALIATAGIVPDIDGLGLLIEAFSANSRNPLLWWTEYHHVLHNITFCILFCTIASWFANRRFTVFSLSFFSFHFHLLCDFVGSGGPNGEIWTIPYFLPFSEVQLAYASQWPVNARPNIAFTIVLLAFVFRLAYTHGYSPLMLLSRRADEAFVKTLRDRFGHTTVKK